MERAENFLDKLIDSFEKANHQASDEAEKLLLLLNILRESYQLIRREPLLFNMIVQKIKRNKLGKGKGAGGKNKWGGNNNKQNGMNSEDYEDLLQNLQINGQVRPQGGQGIPQWSFSGQGGAQGDSGSGGKGGKGKGEKNGGSNGGKSGPQSFGASNGGQGRPQGNLGGSNGGQSGPQGGFGGSNGGQSRPQGGFGGSNDGQSGPQGGFGGSNGGQRGPQGGFGGSNGGQSGPQGGFGGSNGGQSGPQGDSGSDGKGGKGKGGKGGGSNGGQSGPQGGFGGSNGGQRGPQGDSGSDGKGGKGKGGKGGGKRSQQSNGGIFSRKKRQADLKDSTTKSVSPDLVKNMMAFGLTKLLSTEGYKKKHNQRRSLENEIPKCLIEILWTSNEENISERQTAIEPRNFCSKISSKFSQNLRKLMMMILSKGLPDSLFELKWKKYAEEFMKNDLIKNMTELVMTKALLPMEAKDVKEVLSPIFSFVRGIEKTETDVSNKNIMKLFTSIIDFVDSGDTYKTLAEIIQDLQRIILFK